MWRSRWAAFGAAVAVSLGAGGVFVSQAAPGPEESTIVNVTPQRILDTRVDLGLAGPFASTVSQKLQVTGSVPTATGPTTVVPAGATGVLLNVTAVQPTGSGFVSVRPGDATGSPTTSSLNVTAGTNVPNAVQVALPTSGANAGQVDITYDSGGVPGPTTEMLVDVVGYTTNTGIQELVAEVDALQSQVDLLEATVEPLVNSVSATSGGDQQFFLTTDDQVVRSVSLLPPADGVVLVTSTSYFYGGTGLTARCSLTTGTSVDFNYLQISTVPASDFAATSGTRGFAATEGVLLTVNLVCNSTANVDGEVNDSSLTAIFAPS